MKIKTLTWLIFSTIIFSLFGCTQKSSNEMGSFFLAETEWSIYHKAEWENGNVWVETKYEITKIESESPVYCLLMNPNTEKGFLDGVLISWVDEENPLPAASDIYYMFCSRSPFSVDMEITSNGSEMKVPGPHYYNITTSNKMTYEADDEMWYISEYGLSLRFADSNIFKSAEINGNFTEIVPYFDGYNFENTTPLNYLQEYTRLTFEHYMEAIE